jgi:hypothetical protein
MNRWQKIAWFNLIVILAGSVISVVAAGRLPRDERLVPPNRVTAVIIISFVLVATAKTIFRKPDEAVDFDERDAQIHHRAILFDWTGFGLGMVATTMLCYFVVGPMGSFPPLALPIIPLVGAGLYIIASSVAALIQYGWKIEGEKS